MGFLWHEQFGSVALPLPLALHLLTQISDELGELVSETVNNKSHCDRTQTSDEICHISNHYSELCVTWINIIRLEIGSPEILN